MTLKEAQAIVDKWITTVGVRYFSPLTNMAVLTEEVGEVARVMARRYGDQSFKSGEEDTLADELADVMWVVMAIANQSGIDLSEAFARNLEKKTTRDSNRHKNNEKLTK
ncbi:MAG: nucleotide pyrophosphohydrolase [Muribaculum sp.]|nr:nucleotide pyrophosphohydrolase [Muribaculum sp.]